ncbi:MAG TPA: flagellar basal body rod protein FlgB [Pseudolabrys sp.]|nr:flagellar basal body rod protein FlgB [Pseudolabrys sp.]
MAIVDIPIFSMLRTRMQWGQERQRVLAENIANADTPNFRPHDLVPPSFGSTPTNSPGSPSVVLAQTEPGHFGGSDEPSAIFRSRKDEGYEVRPAGNSVSLEDEMMKLASNQMDYQTAAALYTRSLNLLKTALGKTS